MNDIIAAFISYYKSRAFCRKFKVGSFEEGAVQSDMRHLSRRYDFGKTLTPLSLSCDCRFVQDKN